MTNKPNFFIVGTPKGGTTSLFNYLDEHPEIFVPKIKEPHFFSYPEVASTYYRTTIIDTPEAYGDLYRKAGGYRAIGDLSSSYLFNSQSALRIKEFTPNARIVIVLRNPVDRAVSHYLMDHSLNLIQKPLLEVLTHKEEYAPYYSQYVALGRYEEQLKRYLNVFGEANVLILLSDDLFEQTERTVARIFDFLKVDASFKPNFDKKYNKYKEPRFKIIGTLKNSRRLRWLFELLPQGLKDRVTKAAFDETKEKPSFEDETKLLQTLFESDIERTEALINKDLSSWKRTTIENR